jgi:hypothetical protein
VVRGLTGLRRDPGSAVITAQLKGTATPPLSDFTPIVAERLTTIPAFGSYRLTQHHPDGYQIHKRTGDNRAGCCRPLARGPQASVIWLAAGWHRFWYPQFLAELPGESRYCSRAD